MTDDQPTPTEQPAEAVALFDAPDDLDDDRSTGTAVYDRVLGRYVGSVNRTGKALSRSDVRQLVGDHPHKVVRV